jgi:tetratricopeptide (TPR) repeat protein
MSDPEREAQAERQVRRGNFREAIALYEQLLTAAPGDERLQRRLAAVRSMLQPSELDRPAALPIPPAPAEEPHTLDALAEACLERGDVERAIRLYERAIEERPHAHLLTERLNELRSWQRGAATGGDTDKKGALERLLSRIGERRR